VNPTFFCFGIIENRKSEKFPDGDAELVWMNLIENLNQGAGSTSSNKMARLSKALPYYEGKQELC
jgi:hypothetical protein